MSYRGGEGCVMQGWGGVCHIGVGWGVSYRGGEGCVMQGWGVSCRGGVECMTHPTPPLENFWEEMGWISWGPSLCLPFGRQK